MGTIQFFASTLGIRGPRASQKSQEIAVRNLIEVGFLVPALRKNAGQSREVCNRVHVGGTLLAAECAIEIRSDAAVPRVARDLADVIDVIDYRIERHARALRCRLST